MRMRMRMRMRAPGHLEEEPDEFLALSPVLGGEGGGGDVEEGCAALGGHGLGGRERSHETETETGTRREPS